MKTYRSLQTMTLYKERMPLPTLENKQKGAAISFLNTSKKSIVDILDGKHPLLSNNGALYKNYYAPDEDTLGRCVKSPRLNKRLVSKTEARMIRLQEYGEIKGLSESIKCPLRPDGVHGRNTVIDYALIEKFYLDQEILKNDSVQRRLETFFNTIQQNIVSLPQIEHMCILVDLDEYASHNKNHGLFNILNHLMLLLRRTDSFITKIKSANKWDFQILFFTKSGYFVFDMQKDLEKANLNVLRRLLERLKVSRAEDTAMSIERLETARNMAKSINRRNAVGDDIEDADDYVEKEMVSPDDEIVDKVDDMVEEPDADKMAELLGDDELKKEYMSSVLNKATNQKSAESLKRDEMLREKQKDIKIKGKTIRELTEPADIPEIPTNTVNQMPSTYKNMRNVKFTNFEETYMDTMYEKHIAEMITCMNDKTIPVTVIDVKVEDTSDELTMKETYTVILEDERRRRHTLKFNLPKFIDNKFIYVNGNKKTIQKQFFCNPVVKTGPDEVQICTNYNKIFIRRVGAKFSQNSERFRKLMNPEKYPGVVSFKRGCNVNVNKPYLTCLEYDELAKSYNEITVGKATFIFNAENLDKTLDGKYKSDLNKILVGYEKVGNKKEPIWYYTDEEHQNIDLISVMVGYLDEEHQKEFRSMTVGKKYIYAQATLLAKKIPIVVLLAFFEGLSTVVRKFNDPSVIFTDKKVNGDNRMYIKFSDGYLSYPMSNMDACVLFNGFTECTTGAYSITDMDDRTSYLDIFSELVGTSYVAGAYINYYDFMIDPITLETLKLLNYPEDIVSLAIYATRLLADNDYTSDLDLRNYRLRDNEIVAAILYKNIARSYSRYRQTANNPNPVKITMDEDAVIKELVALPTVEDYSTLSPMVELHKGSTVSMKGVNGMNLDRAYKQDKRAFHDSMMGVCGISTDAGPNCGKVRQLTAEPTVTNALGFIDVTGIDNVDKLNDAQLGVPVELLTPMTHTHDNPSRNMMATKQTCHVIPVKNNCPVLVSTGMDMSVHYRTGNDFSVVAKQDGKVLTVDKTTKIMVVQYKDGTHQAIDLNKHAVKNGGGGFYLVNQLHENFKEGQTFKKNDILAHDPKYYKDNGVMGNRMTFGSLQKIACIGSFGTYQDSGMISKKMSEDMASEITMEKNIILGTNATVEYMVEPGQKITIGDDLIRYEASYDDEELNKLLSNVRDDMKEEIVNLGKSKLQSSYTGEVSDIMVYSTVELDELSPSLKKIVKKYQDAEKSKSKLLDKYDKTKGVYRMGVLLNKPSGVVKPDQFGKIKGYDVGRGVLIEFYITYHDELADGDKLAAFTANKVTIGYQYPKGYEPFTAYRKYEEISSTISPSSILQRNTPSVTITGTCYKVLIELKRKMYEVMTGENYDEVLKQKQPYMVKDRKPTKESVEELVEDRQSVLETVYLLDSSKGSYTSPRYINEGTVVMFVDENVDMSPMFDKFVLEDVDYNAMLIQDAGIIVATEDIPPGKPIRLKV